MKQLCSLILLFFTISSAFSQKIILPQVKVSQTDNAQPMQLQDLSVDILVMGQTAVTTMEMTFYNPNDRVMEGEFEFPLSNGQEVSRFALDINGKLREGVVVDKALGRKAFEDIVRRGIDPGLLEKT
ncbi:MAG: trypsin, partial [Capnocytophaga sp.]